MSDDIPKIVHMLEEFKRNGGDPEVFIQKMNSVLSLSEQIGHLTRMRDGIQQRIAIALNEERQALSRRDDALESKKAAENQRDAAVTVLANLLGAKATVEDILRKIEEQKDYLSRLEAEKAESEQYIVPARWALGVLANQPDLLRKHRDQLLKLLDQLPTEQAYTDEVNEKIIHLTINEVTKLHGLVPKNKFTLASQAADNLKFRMDWVIKPFLRDPSQLTLEQRRLLIGTLLDAGLTRDNLEEFRTRLAISWRKCPTHKEIDLKVNTATLKFECTSHGCTYAE